jgi:hypothetical protein
MARLDVSRLGGGGGFVPAVEDNADVIAAKKMAADIAKATGQNVDPNTGQIIIDQAAIAKKFPTPSSGKVTGATVVSTYTDPNTGDVIALYSDGSRNVLSKGTKNLEAKLAADTLAAEKTAARQSAYDLLYSQFKQYGLETLVEPLKGLITSGASPSEFTIRLRETDAYKKRFAGNAARIAKGLRALGEDEYLALEDQYQNVMRNYGLPTSYYAKDALGTQQGFTNLIAGNVSATELENRIQQATDVIDKGPKEYIDAIKQFYPDISRGDLLSYVLDPENALTKIQSKIGAAKIGGEYLRAGLTADAERAEYLQRQGVTADAARQGAQTVLATAPRGGVLADIYQTGPYGQAQVEEEVYGLGKAAEARKLREKLTSLEKASFSGGAGAAQGALGRERALGQGQI